MGDFFNLDCSSGSTGIQAISAVARRPLQLCSPEWACVYAGVSIHGGGLHCNPVSTQHSQEKATTRGLKKYIRQEQVFRTMFEIITQVRII